MKSAVNTTEISIKSPQGQLDRTHTIAAHMGLGAPKVMLVTFVIGADDSQCHKNPIATIIVGNKQRWCTAVRLRGISGSNSLFQTTPEKTTQQFQLLDPIRLVWKPFEITPTFS